MTTGADFAWGKNQTQFFFELTPDRVLEAVESAGLVCTGRCMALGSFENRVYEVELEVEDPQALKSPSERFRIVKFYRPGRWSEVQILEEHKFLLDLQKSEIPVIAPISFTDGKTLHQEKGSGIWFTLFPKVGGRAPDEMTDDQLLQVGRLLARVHGVGASEKAENRIRLHPSTYGVENLKFLLDAGTIPEDYRERIRVVVERICETTTPWFDSTPVQRIHGDCHLQNLLHNQNGFFFLDFDDMVRGPCVQDLWLLVRGRDEEASRQLRVLLEGYEQMRDFDRSTLRLIEPLRALRQVHFAAWIAKRWEDPAFPRAFPFFGSPRYWEDLAQGLRESLALIASGESVY